MNILGLIPARGGSKGVKGKNIRIIDGKPLIHYSIEAATDSEVLNFLAVDTDDEEIGKVASETGVQLLMRPKELAQDNSNIVDVALRVLEQFEIHGIPVDILVLLQPTAPIRTGNNIDEAVQMLIDNPEEEAVISVVPMEDTHPARMYYREDDRLISLDPELEFKRRQELEPVFYRNGCIYAIRTQVLKSQKTFMPKKKLGYVMNSNWLANIDDERDLILTEALVKAWKENRI